MRRAILMLLAIAACDPAEHRDARERYNEGVELLAKGDFEKAEQALLDARSNAGVDPELRFRAAYDLGIAYAAHADQQKTGKDADLGKALALEQQAVSWFADASRLRGDDADAKANLAIAKARAAALADELGRGEGKLEARLDKVIDAQRKLLDGAREAWNAIKQTGGGDPLAQKQVLGKLADDERGIVAEAGVIGDLAADEIDEIGKKPEDKRTPDEKVRVVQLKNLDIYLLDGRAKIAEARRKLQDLAAEDGVARADAALAALKRAREQLLDPISALRAVAREQVDQLKVTTAVNQAIGQRPLELGAGVGSAAGSASAAAAPAIPAWLEPPQLAQEETNLRDRVEELRARLQAGVDNADKPTGAGANAEPPKMTAEQAKTIEHVRAALPHVADGSAAMQRAHDALATSDLRAAVTAERDALTALAKAIEEFSDLKQTIELAYGTQHDVVGLLSPEAAQLPPAERAQDTRDGVASNLTRVARIKDQIAEQLAGLDAKQQELDAKAAGTGSAAPDPKQVEAAKDQLAQEKQRLNAAEALRGDAAKALDELDQAIAKNADPLAKAKLAEAKLAELRKLFFSVIEHLQELVREQGETRDQTAQADSEDDFTREPKLPGLAQHEGEHDQMAEAITEALAKQADAQQQQKAQQKQAAPQQGGPQYAAAADEVRQGKTEMDGAKATLDKAVATKTQSTSLAPSVEHQGKALDHLKKALELLQPPQQQNKDDKDQQKQQQQQQQQQQKPDQPKPDQQQGGAGQRVRDEDAKRQRDKQQQQQPPNDPVDQDW